jgi:hypothetical protein
VIKKQRRSKESESTAKGILMKGHKPEFEIQWAANQKSLNVYHHDGQMVLFIDARLSNSVYYRLMPGCCGAMP